MNRIRTGTWLKIMTAVLVFNALISGGAFQYFLLFALLITLVFSFLFLWRNSKSISHLFFSSAESGTVGEDLTIAYKLTNNGALPILNARATMFISKKLGDSGYPVENLLFKPFQFTNIEHRIRLKHHGYYRLGKIRVDLKDPLGLFFKQVSFDREIDLTIYPRVIRIDRFPLPHRERFGRTDVKLLAYEDFTNIKDSREYVPGDSYKKIHWKLTAKTGKLHVKEYNLSASGKVTFYIDGFRENYSEQRILDEDEKLVEMAAGLIHYYLRHRFEVSLVTLDHNRKQLVDGKSLRQFDLFLHALTGFTPNADIDMTRMIQADTEKLSAGATIVVFSPKAGREMAALLQRLRRRRIEVQFITLDQHKEHHQRLERMGIRYQSVGLDEDSKERLEAF